MIQRMVTYINMFIQDDLEDGNGTFTWTDGYKYDGGWSKEIWISKMKKKKILI